MYFLKNKIDKVVIPIDHELSESMLEAYDIVTDELYRDYLKIQELKRKLASTDYQAIKFAEGLIGQEEYDDIKAQRQSWRDEINILESHLE